MASKKKSSRKHAPGDGVIRRAISGGRSIALDVLEFRSRHRRARAATERTIAAAPRGRRAPATQIPAKTRAMLGGPASAGVLIAEGDSWFDYPFHDVLQLLEDEHLYDVESVASKGDRVEDMAHSGGQYEEFARRLEKLLRASKVPRAILLSGGGNDIAGDDFALLLNHATSQLQTLNEDILRGVIDVRLKAAYARIITGLTEIAQFYLGKPIPIVTHGYAYALPDGRGFMGGLWFLPGPWLQPGFRKKGYVDFQRNAGIVVQLINRFNKMLMDVSASPKFPQVRYLDLRDILLHDPTGKKYRRHWANELHPTEEGFRLVTQKFADLIAKL